MVFPPDSDYFLPVCRQTVRFCLMKILLEGSYNKQTETIIFLLKLIIKTAKRQQHFPSFFVCGISSGQMPCAASCFDRLFKRRACRIYNDLFRLPVRKPAVSVRECFPSSRKQKTSPLWASSFLGSKVRKNTNFHKTDTEHTHFLHAHPCVPLFQLKRSFLQARGNSGVTALRPNHKISGQIFLDFIWRNGTAASTVAAV